MGKSSLQVYNEVTKGVFYQWYHINIVSSKLIRKAILCLRSIGQHYEISSRRHMKQNFQLKLVFIFRFISKNDKR